MSSHVSWFLDLNIQAGREKDFKNLLDEMVAATRANEPGTLDYEWSTSADGTECHLFERYADSEAALTHIATFGETFAKRFLEILQPQRFVVYGSPSPAVKSALAGFNPVYMSTVGGFSR